MRTFFFILLIFNSYILFAQSFNDEKTSAINFIKRVYNATAFEGAKKIEGEEGSYCVVAVSFMNLAKDSVLAYVPKAQLKAQVLAEQGFAEPCVKFEMIQTLENGAKTCFLFFCETLDGFVYSFLKKKLIDGARIVSAPGNKYIISTVSLENAKYTSPEIRDKVAQMKAKQLVNTLVNGSTITSDIIIRTDESDKNTEVNNTEFIREQSMGFIQGLELLFAKEITSNKTTYVFFSKI